MECHIKNALPNFKMLDYRVEYDNHPLFSSEKATGRKFGSPVRMFTNITPKLVALDSRYYKYCAICKFWAANENRHCLICGFCTSKDGKTYSHCAICDKCVKPTYKHCLTCKRCCLETHKCETFTKRTFISGGGSNRTEYQEQSVNNSLAGGRKRKQLRKFGKGKKRKMSS